MRFPQSIHLGIWGKYSPRNFWGKIFSWRVLRENISLEMFVGEDFPCSRNNWENFSERENFPAKGNIFPKVNIFPFWWKYSHFRTFSHFWDFFPPLAKTQKSDKLERIRQYLRHFLYLQTKVLEVSIYEVPRKYSPGNLGKIFPQKFWGKIFPWKFLRENIPLEMFTREDFLCSLNNWESFTEREYFPA